MVQLQMLLVLLLVGLLLLLELPLALEMLHLQQGLLMMQHEVPLLTPRGVLLGLLMMHTGELVALDMMHREEMQYLVMKHKGDLGMKLIGGLLLMGMAPLSVEMLQPHTISREVQAMMDKEEAIIPKKVLDTIHHQELQGLKDRQHR